MINFSTYLFFSINYRFFFIINIPIISYKIYSTKKLTKINFLLSVRYIDNRTINISHCFVIKLLLKVD